MIYYSVSSIQSMSDSLARLTQAQTRVLLVFREHEEAGQSPPTLRQLCKRFGWKSSAAARDHVAALIRKGGLSPGEHGRPGAFLPSTIKRVPLVDVEKAVANGFVQIGEIPLPPFLHPGGDAFAMNIVDNAMAGAGVIQADIVIALRSPKVEPGCLAVIQVKRALRVRRVETRAGKVVAASVPARGKKQTRPLSAKAIHGRVTGLLRDYQGS